MPRNANSRYGVRRIGAGHTMAGTRMLTKSGASHSLRHWGWSPARTA